MGRSASYAFGRAYQCQMVEPAPYMLVPRSQRVSAATGETQSTGPNEVHDR